MIYAIVAVLILIADQLVKYWTVHNLASVGATQDFIPNVIELTRVHNTGAAFGLGADSPASRWIYIALTIIFIAVIVFILAKKLIKGKTGRWLLLLILAGGIGNFIDRIVNGYVVDMFHFAFLPIELWGKSIDFPVFNIADMFVTVCGIIFCFWLIFNKTENWGKKKSDDISADDDADMEYTPRERTRQQRERKPALRRREEQAVPAGDDYITQLKKPVAEAKVILEQQRAAAASVSSEKFDPNDPFAEFTSKPAPVFEEPKPAPETAAPETASPAQQPEPAPKKKDTDFTLDDIMREFSDQ